MSDIPTPAEVPQRVRDEAFQRGLSNAPLWFTSGGDLLRAAQAVWERVVPVFQRLTVDEADVELVRYLGPFYLLCGLAVENYLKALIVKDLFGRQDGLPDPKAPLRLPVSLNDHDLRDLAERAHFECSEKERQLLSCLTRYTTWAGRYPIPKTSAGMFQRVAHENDMKRVEDFVNRVIEEYDRRPFRSFERPAAD